MAYGLRLPLSQCYVVVGDDPKPGEVVVLDSPETETVLLKRVVAGLGIPFRMIFLSFT